MSFATIPKPDPKNWERQGPPFDAASCREEEGPWWCHHGHKFSSMTSATQCGCVRKTPDDETRAKALVGYVDALAAQDFRESETAEQDAQRREAAERLRISSEHTTSDDDALQAVQVQVAVAGYEPQITIGARFVEPKREPLPDDVPTLTEVIGFLAGDDHLCGGDDERRALTGLGCGVEISHHGICEDCADREREALFRSKVMGAASSSIPLRFRWAQFGRAELLTRVKSAQAISDALEIMRGKLPLALVLVGKAGTGKTTLACAMLRRIHDTANRLHRELQKAEPGERRNLEHGVDKASRSFFVSASEMIHETTRTARWEQPKLFARAVNAALLVLDDVGQHNDPENLVRTLLEQRANASRPTIFTTPFSRDQLTRRYGDGLSKRLYEVVISC